MCIYVHVYVHVWAFPLSSNNSRSSEHHYWWFQPGNPGNHLAWLEVKKLYLLSVSRAKPGTSGCQGFLSRSGSWSQTTATSCWPGSFELCCAGVIPPLEHSLPALVLWGRRLLINPRCLIHQINNKVILNALKLPHNHSENLWGSSMASQEQDAFQVSSSGPLTIQRDGAQTLMIGIAERSNYCNYTCVCVLQY